MFSPQPLHFNDIQKRLALTYNKAQENQIERVEGLGITGLSPKDSKSFVSTGTWGFESLPLRPRISPPYLSWIEEPVGGIIIPN